MMILQIYDATDQLLQTTDHHGAFSAVDFLLHGSDHIRAIDCQHRHALSKATIPQVSQQFRLTHIVDSSQFQADCELESCSLGLSRNCNC